MDKYKIINEASKKISTKIKADFTVAKPLKLKPDGGATRDSLANAKLIKDAGYELKNAWYYADTQRGDYRLKAEFIRDGKIEEHIFKGFSVGYGGEGPHGFVEFGRIFNLGLKEDKIFGRDYINNDEKKYVNISYFQ